MNCIDNISMAQIGCRNNSIKKNRFRHTFILYLWQTVVFLPLSFSCTLSPRTHSCGSTFTVSTRTSRGDEWMQTERIFARKLLQREYFGETSDSINGRVILACTRSYFQFWLYWTETEWMNYTSNYFKFLWVLLNGKNGSVKNKTHVWIIKKKLKLQRKIWKWFVVNTKMFRCYYSILHKVVIFLC